MLINCSLSNDQERATLKLLGKIVDDSAVKSTEDILKDLYNTIYESFSKKGDDRGMSFALSMTEYASKNLHLLLSEHKNQDVRDAMQTLLGNKTGLTPESILKYSDRNELMKLLNIKLEPPIKTEFPTTPESVVTQLDKIKNSFPQLKDSAIYKAENLPGATWKFTILKTKEGDIKLPEVTAFLQNKRVKNPMENSDTSYTRAGNLADMVVRKFIRSKPSSHEDFRNSLIADNDFKSSFTKFMGVDNIDSPLAQQYAKDYLHDMSYALGYIVDQYKGYHLTDLHELIDKSGMSEMDKARFFIYSAEVGLKGEPDIIALSPSGKFRVIDVKTTNGDVNPANAEKYNKQTSIYDLIIQKATGLQSEGSNDIIYLNNSISNASQVLGVANGPNRVSVISYNKVSTENRSPVEMLKDITNYRKTLDDIYKDEIKTEQAPAGGVAARPLAFNPLSRGRLKSLFKEQEDLTSIEHLEEQKKWLLSTFPELGENSVNILRVLNSDAGAEFFRDAINLYTRGNIGDGYHEGWHRFSQLYLSPKERASMYDDVRSLAINYTTRDGRDVNTKTANDLDVEEFVADEFRKYGNAADKGKENGYKFPKEDKTTGKTKSIFQRIWEAIKRIFDFFKDKGSFAFEDAFEDLHSGTFNRSNYDPNNMVFDHLNSLFIDSRTGRTEVLDNQTFLNLKDFADEQLTKYMRDNDIVLGNMLSRNGMVEVTKVLIDRFDGLRSNLGDVVDSLEISRKAAEDEGAKASVEAMQNDYFHYVNAIDKVLEKDIDGAYTVFPDFLRAYLATTEFESLKGTIGRNLQMQEDVLSKLEDPETPQEGDGDEQFSAQDDDFSLYNNPGNAFPADEIAGAAIKDFFVGIPRMTDSSIKTSTSPDQYEYSSSGLTVKVPKKEALYKTLEILQGSQTLSNILEKISDPTNQLKFPELLFVKERFLGSADNQGLIPRVMDLDNRVKSGDLSAVEEHTKLTGFLMNFTSAMSLRKVQLQNFVTKTNYEKGDDRFQKVSPLASRDNIDIVINSIIGDFTSGFQKNAIKSFTKSASKEFTNVFDIMHSLYVKEKDPNITFFTSLKNTQFIYDPVYRKFYFNPFYANSLYNTSGNTPDKLKAFFDYLGMNINDKIYSDYNDFGVLLNNYNSLRDILNVFHRQSLEKAVGMMNSPVLKSTLVAWKDLSDKMNALPAGPEKIAAGSSLGLIQQQLRGYANSIFSSNPVQDLLYAGKDLKLRKDPTTRIFAINRPIFESIAKIEKKYHKRFSSGSELVIDKPEYSYFQNNHMTLIESLLNDSVNNFSDFNKHAELTHLDPALNPQVLNSAIFKNMFNQNTGEKNSNYKLGVTNISQVTLINSDSSIEAKRLSDTTEEEKMLYDLLMVRSEGSGEMRRMETSNRAWRLSLMKSGADGYFNAKIIKIGQDGFENPNFLRIIQGYIQHASFGYKFYQDPINAAAAVNYKGKAKLGVFDDMLLSTSSKLKKIVVEEKDLNSLFSNLEKSNPDLLKDVNKEIVSYFDDISVGAHPDSYKNYIKKNLSTKSREVLSALKDVNTSQVLIDTDLTGMPKDAVLKDFRANDFIMAMEDCILMFGDYTYDSDPGKRRKYGSNTGSIDKGDPITNQLMLTQYQNNSIASIYHAAKGTKADKDFNLVKKLVFNDLEIESNVIKTNEAGEIPLVKDIQDLRKQVFGIDQDYNTVKDSKAVVLGAFSKMNVADAGAVISMDTYRRMLIRENRWDWIEHEGEYTRQQLIMKRNLLGEDALSDEEKNYIATRKGHMNIAKFALTGPVYSTEPGPMRPVFDKMGMRVLLPEFDWNSSMRPVFEDILKNNADYAVMESGTKRYKPVMYNLFDKTGKNTVFKGGEYTPHAAGFFKNQLNTVSASEDVVLPIQLRGLFFENKLIMEKYGKATPEMQDAYDGFVNSLKSFVSLQSNKILLDMGLNRDGSINNKETFANYVRNRLKDSATVPPDVLDRLSTNLSGNFNTFLEALPFTRDTMNLLAGLCDNMRKVRVNGSKLVATPEVFTTKPGQPGNGGTVGLKWHTLARDENGKITHVTPMEMKRNISPLHKNLLRVEHPDGKPINYSKNEETTLRRFNEAIKNPEWFKKYENSLRVIVPRVPMSDGNFVSHATVNELLPGSMGDCAVTPIEYYMQTGQDNDIDSNMCTQPWLDANGMCVQKPVETYDEISTGIEDLLKTISSQKADVTSLDDEDINQKIENLKQEFIDNSVYFEAKAGLADLDKDLLPVTIDGVTTFEGLLSPNSVLSKIIRSGDHQSTIDSLYELFNEINEDSSPAESNMSKLLDLSRKREQYMKGVSNDMFDAMYYFMQLPENYDMLTETDSMDHIKNIAKDITAIKSDKKASEIVLDAPKTSLEYLSYETNQVNHRNNAQVRTIIGAMLKFRRIQTTLAEIGVPLNTTYYGGNMNNLITKYDTEQGDDYLPAQVSKVINKMGKTYEVKIRTPLLYKKDVSKGIALSIFDEDGGRITKNISMMSVALLDLFKNPDTFPSLGVTWLNVKPLVFLMAQGVPDHRALLFLNNPVVQEVQKNFDLMGTNVQDRHALVQTSQDLFENELHPEIDARGRDQFKVYVTENGRTIPNQMMRRHIPQSEAYLTENVDNGKFELTEVELTQFTRDFAKYTNDPARKDYDRNLKWFLKRNKQYTAVTKNILAYYSTLLESSSLFYRFFVQSINRSTSKHNSFAMIGGAEATTKARIASRMSSPAFENELKNNSLESPFYMDKLVRNILKSTMPELLNYKGGNMGDHFISLIERLSSQINGTMEDKTQVGYKAQGDILDYLYKNFYLISHDDNGKLVGNTPYEYFEYDITPLLKPLVEGIGSVSEVQKGAVDAISTDDKIRSGYSDKLFPSQVEFFKTKYPELSDNTKLLQNLLVERVAGVDPGKSSGYEAKDVLNMLDQNYVYLNLSRNSSDRQDDEVQIRDEWQKLENFDLSQFPMVEMQVMRDEARLKIYKDPANIAEVRKFMKVLSFYSLNAASHLTASRGSFSYLMPPGTLKEIIETSITNFKAFIDKLPPKSQEATIKGILGAFGSMFKDMNGDLDWQGLTRYTGSVDQTSTKPFDGTDDAIENPAPEREYYRPYMKAYTGKLYSKTKNAAVEGNKKFLMESAKITPGRNAFAVDLFKSEKDDFTC